MLIKLNLLTSRTIISVVGRGLKLWCGVVDIRPKGQLISECLFDVLNFAKNQRKKLTNSAPESKKWSNQQNKGTFLQYYNVHIV